MTENIRELKIFTNSLLYFLLEPVFNFNSLVPSGFRDLSELRVRVKVIYLWLNALKHLNPMYRNASIIETEAIKNKLLNISAELLANATIVDNNTEIMIDQLITPEGSNYVLAGEVQEDGNEPHDQPMPVSLLTRSTPVAIDDTQSASAAFRGLWGKFLSFADISGN